VTRKLNASTGAKPRRVAVPKTDPLVPLRAQIDAVDAQLLELLNRRADLVHGVGEVKRSAGQEIYVPEREEQVLRALEARSKGRLPASAIRAIYREIMSASFALEKGLTIAFFGPAATFTHQAARAKFGASVAYEACPTIADVFSVVSRGHADYGVVPIENSTEGVVNHTLDVFADSDLKICAQILLRIEQHLLAKCPRTAIHKVYSHPQSFGQCRQWIMAHLSGIECVEVSSNARATELAASEAGAAAIAGRLAGEAYGLDLLEEGIQDSADNTTRFLVLGRATSAPTGNDKTSIMFSVKDRAGALFEAIAPFKELRINMSKIESRPSKRKAWEYFFFADIAGHARDAKVAKALAALERHCTLVKILGSYPNTAA